MSRKEIINQIRRDAQVNNNEEAENLIAVLCGLAPYILENPEAATKEQVESYNRLIYSTIDDEELVEKYTIKE